MVYDDVIEKIEASLPKEIVIEARRKARQEILKFELAQLRKKRGFRQKNLKRFSQSGISKLESRKDMKISTLADYLDELGMRLEIKALPREEHSKEDEVILVST